MDSRAVEGGISVVVPTYNRRDFLPAAVASLLGQTVLPCEIIVVNDGSDYNVRELLRHFGNLVSVIDKSNEGKPAAVNHGIEQASGDFIWVFDDDDIAENRFIEQCLPYLALPGVDYVFGWHYAGESLSREMVRKDHERRPRLESNSDIFAALLSGCSIAHNAIIARKSCYQKLGGMDVTYPCSEDYEFQLRLARECRGRFLDVPSFTRRVHSGERGGSRFRYPARERRRRFLEQDRRFLATYLQELPLTAYWLASFTEIEDSLMQVRAQYLYKFQVAASVGLWEVAMATLEEAAADSACASGALIRDEAAQINTVFVYAEPEVLCRLEIPAHMLGIRRLAVDANSSFLRDFARVFRTALIKRMILQARSTHVGESAAAGRLLFQALRMHPGIRGKKL